MRSNRPWANALTGNFVRTECRDYTCPIFVTVWAQKAVWAFTMYNAEHMQDFGPEMWGWGGRMLRSGHLLGVFTVHVIMAETVDHHMRIEFLS